TNPIDRVLIAVFVLNRAVAMAALLGLAAVPRFILWFRVEMRRKLSIFRVGLVAYFAVKVALLLARSYLSHESTRLLSTTMAFVVAACFAYGIVFITQQGQAVQVRWGHSWRLDEQRRLMNQLQSMNTA